MPVEAFGKYELLGKLGQGGMAEAWRAQLKGAAGVVKPCVIKMVLKNFAANPEFVEDFISEARICTTLSHGNIAQVFDFGQVKGRYYLALEWVHGRSLGQLMRRAEKQGFWHLPIPLACFIAIEMLKGLHHAHARQGQDGEPLNLVHRDVTPDNVLLSYEGEVKVADFGIAKAQLKGRSETQVGIVKGKYQYFSPEQAQGFPLDARSDLHSVGVCLYEMLCGRRPYVGEYLETVAALVDGEREKVDVLNPDVPAKLVALVERSLATDKDQRFPTALAMQEALQTFLYSHAKTFSGERLKVLLEHLFREEMKKDGLHPRSEEELEEVLEPMRPSGPAPAPADAEPATVPGRGQKKGGDAVSTMMSLDPVAEQPATASAGLTRGLVLGGVGVFGLLIVVGVAWLLFDAPAPANEMTPFEGGSPELEARAPKPPKVAPPPPVVAPVPKSEPQKPTGPTLEAATQVVSPGHVLLPAVELVVGHRYRLGLMDIQEKRAVVSVAFQNKETWSPWRVLVPHEKLDVGGKSGLRVLCAPGPSFDATEAARVEVEDLTLGTKRVVQLDLRRQCWDFSSARTFELDPGQRYQLTLAASAEDVSLGGGVPIAVAWRTAQVGKVPGFAVGQLKLGASAEFERAKGLEVAFLDDDASDNHGAVGLELKSLGAAGPSEAGGGEVTVVKNEGVMTFAESMKLPVVKKAYQLLDKEKFQEALAVLEPCFKLKKIVPTCERFKAGALIGIGDNRGARAAYLRYLEHVDHTDPYADQVRLGVQVLPP